MGYAISTVRFKDEQYEELIDKLLILPFYGEDAYVRATNALEKLMRDSKSFTDKFIDFTMRHLRRKNAEAHLSKHGVYTKNLHNHLGPGGYVLEKVDDEEELE